MRVGIGFSYLPQLVADGNGRGVRMVLRGLTQRIARNLVNLVNLVEKISGRINIIYRIERINLVNPV